MPTKDPDYHRNYRQKNRDRVRAQTAERVRRHRQKTESTGTRDRRELGPAGQRADVDPPVPAHDALAYADSRDEVRGNGDGQPYSPVQLAEDRHIYQEWLADGMPAPWSEDFDEPWEMDRVRDETEGYSDPLEDSYWWVDHREWKWLRGEPEFVCQIVFAIEVRRYSHEDLKRRWSAPVVRKALRRLHQLDRLGRRRDADGNQRFAVWEDKPGYGEDFDEEFENEDDAAIDEDDAAIERRLDELFQKTKGR